MEDINYLEIILKGYFNENNREHLKNYFRRECKKTEKEYYSTDEFYSGCLKVIKYYEHEIKKKYFERKNEISFMLNNIDKGTIDTGKDNPKEIKERWMQELESLNKNDFSVTLSTGGHLWNKDIIFIQNALLEAKNNSESQPEKRKDEATNNTEQKLNSETKKPTDKPENPNPRYFINFESYSLFSALQKQIVRPKFQLADYSFIYRKMKDEGLIYEGIKESEFREFLNREYQTELFEPLKTLLNCKTDHKMSVYSNLINSK